MARLAKVVRWSRRRARRRSRTRCCPRPRCCRRRCRRGPCWPLSEIEELSVPRRRAPARPRSGPRDRVATSSTAATAARPGSPPRRDARRRRWAEAAPRPWPLSPVGGRRGGGGAVRCRQAGLEGAEWGRWRCGPRPGGDALVDLQLLGAGVTLSGSGGFWQRPGWWSRYGGSGEGVMVAILRRLKGAWPRSPGLTWTSSPVSPASRRSWSRWRWQMTPGRCAELIPWLAGR